MRLIGEAPSRGVTVDLWYARIIAMTCAAIENCCYVEMGVNYEALSLKVIAPYAAESHGCDVRECDVPEDTTLWVMTTAQFLLSYDGNAPDVVFIDADHSYDAVRQDFVDTFARWPNAIVFLHDTYPLLLGPQGPIQPPQTDTQDCGGVWRLREQIEESPKYESFTWRQDPGLTLVRRK